MRKRSFLLVFVLLAVLIAGCGGKEAVGGVSTSKDTGAAQEAQVKSGEAIYTAQCAACHDPNRSAALLNDKTLASYGDAKVFFDYVSVAMPRSSPGSLKTQEYWDLIAYVAKNASKLPKDVVLSADNAATVSFK